MQILRGPISFIRYNERIQFKFSSYQRKSRQKKNKRQIKKIFFFDREKQFCIKQFLRNFCIINFMDKICPSDQRKLSFIFLENYFILVDLIRPAVIWYT